MDRSQTPAPGRMHHIGFVVDDHQNAAESFARTYGIGPLLAVPSRASYRMESLLEPSLVRHGVEPFLHVRTGPVEVPFFIDPKRPSYLAVQHDNPFLAAVESAMARIGQGRDEPTPLQILTRNEATR